MQIAMGSASEVEYLLLLGRDLRLLLSQDYEELPCEVIEIERMLTSLIKTLRS